MTLAEIPLAQFLDEAGAYLRRTPLEGTLETTYRCNLNCVHCYVNLAADAAEKRQELSLERLKTLVDQIAAEGCLDLLLTGGEVLLRPDFPELYLHAVRAGLRVTVFTNGTILSGRVLDLFETYHPACVEITLYGMSRETYERVTRVPGSYDLCLSGIRRLHERGIPLKLKTMVLSWNAHEVEAMRRFAESLGVSFRFDSLLNPRVDCGASRKGELQVPAELAVALEREDPKRRTMLEEAFEELRGAPPVAAADELFMCGAGRSSFMVDPYGQLHLCQLARRASFDLRTADFARGWDFLGTARAQRWKTEGPCRTCSLGGMCGSCAGAAELEHGDPEAVVAEFCEITHLRAWTYLGEASGHRRDATCCRGSGRLASRPDTERSLGGCGSCGGPPAEPPLIRLDARSRAKRTA